MGSAALVAQFQFIKFQAFNVIDAFLLKKVVSVFIHFIPGVPALLLSCLLLRRWLPKFSYFMSLMLCVLLIASSVPGVFSRVVSSLEDQFEVLPYVPADTGLILVHGWSHMVSDKPLPINTQLYPVALTRLMEGVRLWQTKPDTMFALSGAAPRYGTPSHAEKMHEMALLLGVPEERIIRFDLSLDTEDEIDSAVAWLQQNPQEGRRLVVVSTAMHLPRSEAALSKYDIDYSMAPTEFIISEGGLKIPSIYPMVTLDRAIHEWVGILWYRLKNL